LSTQFELHVDVAFVFEAVFESDNVWMIHRLMNFDLRKKLFSQTERISTSQSYYAHALAYLGFRFG
jgi:hypothetical protein